MYEIRQELKNKKKLWSISEYKGKVNGIKMNGFTCSVCVFGFWSIYQHSSREISVGGFAMSHLGGHSTRMSSTCTNQNVKRVKFEIYDLPQNNISQIRHL